MKFISGDVVILGRHTTHHVDGLNWVSDMDPYVGCTTVITNVSEVSDVPGLTTYEVEGNSWSWREEALTLVSRAPKTYAVSFVSFDGVLDLQFVQAPTLLEALKIRLRGILGEGGAMSDDSISIALNELNSEEEVYQYMSNCDQAIIGKEVPS